jgi:hypothetical protein
MTAGLKADGKTCSITICTFSSRERTEKATSTGLRGQQNL